MIKMFNHEVQTEKGISEVEGKVHLQCLARKSFGPGFVNLPLGSRNAFTCSVCDSI